MVFHSTEENTNHCKHIKIYGVHRNHFEINDSNLNQTKTKNKLKKKERKNESWKKTTVSTKNHTKWVHTSICRFVVLIFLCFWCVFIVLTVMHRNFWCDSSVCCRSVYAASFSLFFSSFFLQNVLRTPKYACVTLMTFHSHTKQKI